MGRVPSMVVAKSGRYYLTYFEADDVTLKKMVMKEMAAESQSSALTCTDRKWKVGLKLGSSC